MKTKLPALKDAIKLHKDMDQYEKDLSFIHEKVLPELGELENASCVVIKSVPPGAIRILKENRYPVELEDGRILIYKNWFLYWTRHAVRETTRAFAVNSAIVIFLLTLLLGPLIACFMVGNPVPAFFYVFAFPVFASILSALLE